ncbi:MAG: hypothetical protein AAF902_17415 [Chloroflexota bacterium]
MLALIIVSWYFLIQLEVVQYDAADWFSVFLLLAFPTILLIFLVQAYDLSAQNKRSPMLVWGFVLSGVITLVSGSAWFQLIQFFSDLDGFGLGST